MFRAVIRRTTLTLELGFGLLSVAALLEIVSPTDSFEQIRALATGVGGYLARTLAWLPDFVVAAENFGQIQTLVIEFGGYLALVVSFLIAWLSLAAYLSLRLLDPIEWASIQIARRGPEHVFRACADLAEMIADGYCWATRRDAPFF